MLKQSASEELRQAIETVLDNKRFLSQKIALEIREALEDKWLRPEGYSDDLTSRQREILILLSQGQTPKNIGIPQGQHHTEARRSHDRRPHQVRSGPRAYQPLNTFPIARGHLVQPRSQPSDLLIVRL